MPPSFECQRCGACCRQPGFVRVTDEEIKNIAAHLEIAERDFIEHYTRLSPERDGLALIEDPDEACFFLTKENTCRLQPVKPAQCRDFPFTWTRAGWRDFCRGKGKESVKKAR